MSKTVTHKNNIPYFGEEELLKIAPNRSFTAMIFELLSERAPVGNELKLFELILNISIDHGPETPSGVATIMAAQEGKTISEAVSVGVFQINDTHGGAIEPAMELFYKIKKEKLEIKNLVGEYLKEDKKIPGFGHRIYEIDPRAQLIFETAQKEGIGKDFIETAKELDKELTSKKGRPIPANVDAAIAAVLCGFGWDPSLGKAVFIISRTPGLCGQFLNNV